MASKLSLFFIAIFIVTLTSAELSARTIHVPDDHETIQAAINASDHGDEIIVAPGEYIENIDFSGKNISLIGNPDNPEEVVIDGGGEGSVVTFAGREAEEALLSGFTVRNGTGTQYQNRGTYNGGGIYCFQSNPTVSHCLIIENDTNSEGAGVYCEQSNPTIEYCLITDNASHTGGGISSHFNSFPELRYCVVKDNQGRVNAGGAEIWEDCGISLTNCIVFENSPYGIKNRQGGQSIVVNSIIWGNVQANVIGPNQDIHYSCVGGYEGESNIDSDPIFIDSENGNFHLTINSPCIDAGDPESQEDPDGTRADMGVFYFEQRDEREVGYIDTPDLAQSIFVLGNYAYIADCNSGVRVIDISDPVNPIERGFHDTPRNAQEVFVIQDHVFVADRESGLRIIDISDLNEVIEIGYYDTPGIAHGITVFESYAFIADWHSGLRIVDVSDMNNLEEVGAYEDLQQALGIDVANEFAFLAHAGGLSVIDVSDVSDPFEVGNINTHNAAIAVSIVGEIAYVTDHYGVFLIDISDTGNLVEMGNYETPGTSDDISIFGNYAYVADRFSGVRVLDVFNPENINEVGFFNIPNAAKGIFTNGNYAFVASGAYGLRILDISEFAQSCITLSDEELNFGSISVNESTEQTLTITNTGNADLTIQDISITGRYFDCNFEEEITLGQDESHELTVTFTPEWFGEFEGTLTIFSNDPNNGEMVVGLSGTGELDFDEQKITADDGEAEDHFGISVSISGDYAIVGAPYDDDNGDRSGSAYIFTRNGDDWAQSAKLIANDAGANDTFGNTVSISGDYAIIGANETDDDGNASGSAYIFVRDGDDWTQSAKLTANDAAADDYFGTSVSISGNYVVIGAFWDDDDGENSGSAYIFVRDDDDWTQQAKLTANDAAGDDYFGRSVTISGNYAMVGAFGNADDGEDSGSAYIFIRDGDRWSQQAKLTADDAATGDYFGYSVSINGDYAIVGAVLDDDAGGFSGSAYIFTRDGGDWTQSMKLTSNDAAAGDYFGYSVSIRSDYAFVGATWSDDEGNNSGSAYIFTRNDDDWAQSTKLTANDAAANDEFGRSVFTNGDYAIIGTYGDGNGSGSAYIYSIEYPDHPEITVSTNAIDFPNVRPGEASEHILLISNIGNAELRVEDVSIEGEYFSTDFEDEITFQPGEEFELHVTFSPEERGDFEGILTLTSNDPLHEETVVSLAGTGGGITVSLLENWNMISINVSPPQEFYEQNDNRGPDVVLMMEQLRIDEENHHVLLMKNEDGRFYMPSFDFNNIPYWDLTRGYLVKADADCEAVWSGEPIPADTEFWLNEGWNIVAYFPTYVLDAESPDYYVLSPVIDVLEMAKDNDGRFLAPRFHFSNMPPWRETQGYQVKVSEDVLFRYPVEQEGDVVAMNAVKKQSLSLEPQARLLRYARKDGGSENMSLLVSSIFGIDLPVGSQIAAISGNGLIVGSGFVDADTRCGLAIWGDDPDTEEVDGLKPGEGFELRVWDADRNIEFVPDIAQFLEGEKLRYETDALIAIDLEYSNQIPTEFYLASAFPNPFNSLTKISYGLPVEARISINVYDISGRFVTELVNENQVAGIYSVNWNARDVASGVYVLRMVSGSKDFSQKVVLMR